MTKIDIVDKLYEKLDLPKKEVDKVVESVFDIIKETFQREDKLMISGFGDFIVRNKKARRGRNPQTGIAIYGRTLETFFANFTWSHIFDQSEFRCCMNL